MAVSLALRQEAESLASYVPENEPVWILGPSDLAGKNSSILFYLRRPVLAFRPRGTLPPDGSYCLLTSDRMASFEKGRVLEFELIVTVEHPRRNFLLGRCSHRQS